MTSSTYNVNNLDQPTADQLRGMPKIELHCHLDGSMRPETMLELAMEQNVTLPRSNPEELRAYMRADNVSSLEDYLDRFEATISVLQTPDALERAAYELVHDVSADGVRYIEVRNAPRLNTRTGLTEDEVMDATMRGLARAESESGTVARFICCSLRQWSPEVSVETAELAVRYMDRGVVGFDIAGGEAGNPAGAHAAAFLYAREHFLGVTCHAGEGDGAGSIEQALFLCGAYRIGHGVRAGENPQLLSFLRDRQIPLELCPTSNVQTHAVESFAEHPVKRYLDYGVNVTLNTDNRLISGITLTSEFARLIRDLGFTTDDLARCVMNGCNAAFLPLPEREKLAARVHEELRRDWGYSG
ncbi:MAG: adenosine deaminase [Gemmatimonadaceae bacterium]